MKKIIRFIILASILVFVISFLSGCSHSDFLIGEGSFSDVGNAWLWFWNNLVPNYFLMIGEVWAVNNSIIGFFLALLMTILLFICFIIVLVIFFIIIIFLFVLCILLSLIGYVLFFLAGIFYFFFITT